MEDSIIITTGDIKRDYEMLNQFLRLLIFDGKSVSAAVIYNVRQAEPHNIVDLQYAIV